MKKFLMLALFLPLLTACKPGEEKAIELAKKEIALDLKDPDSAKFRFVRVAKKNENDSNKAVMAMVCGQVNAKNAFGAYAGYQHFIILLDMKSKSMFSKGVTYKVTSKKIADSEETQRDINQYRDICGEDK